MNQELKNKLIKFLNSEVVTVTFTKVDGSTRVMQCTLVPEILPKQVVTEDKKKRTQPENILAVYDVEMKGWRSFNINSVKKIKTSSGEEVLE